MAVWKPWYESRKKIRRVIGNNICLLFYLLFILRFEPGNNAKFALTVELQSTILGACAEKP
jgi:hypothetical protein